MYQWTLFAHSWARWLVIVAGVLAVARAVAGLTGRRGWTGADDAAGKWFVMLLDVQLLIGVILYAALSPVTAAAFRDMGAAMANSRLRFWAVEHFVLALAAVVLAHVGRVRTRRAATPAAKHRSALIFYALAVVAALAATPWPFMPIARPLFRL